MTAEMRGAVLVLEVTGLPRVRSKKICEFLLAQIAISPES